jgi:hypothetical protein
MLPIITYFITTSRQIKNAVIAWMLMLLAINYYYKGCPFIRVERKLLNIPSWIGIHEYLRVFTPKPSKSLINATTMIASSIIIVAFWFTY